MAVGTFAIALFPKMSVPVFVPCAPGICGMYCNYGIVFSLMDDGGIPMEVSGTAVGVICTIGYLPRWSAPRLPVSSWIHLPKRAISITSLPSVSLCSSVLWVL